MDFLFSPEFWLKLAADPYFWIKLAISVWMLVISYLDHAEGRIPNALTASVFLGVGAYRVVWEGLWLGQPVRLWLLAAWAIVFGLWMLHFIGGGDAKFLMAQFALFPFMEYVAVLAFVLLILTVPLLILHTRGRSAGGILRGMWVRLQTGQVLPTEEELQEHGKRYAWTYAVPGIVFAWVYW